MHTDSVPAEDPAPAVRKDSWPVWAAVLPASVHRDSVPALHRGSSAVQAEVQADLTVVQAEAQADLTAVHSEELRTVHRT